MLRIAQGLLRTQYQLGSPAQGEARGRGTEFEAREGKNAPENADEDVVGAR